MQSAREAEIAAGRVGRYVLFREIAHGGMATVHLARMRGLAGFARTVAIKRLHPPFARDPEFVSMFLDEARLAARIQHPNVVPVLDVIASAGELFLVMEYVHGEALSKLLKEATASGQRVALPIVVGVIIQVLHGLHAAHEARTERGDPLAIVHRDVSPQNVMVGADGVARVFDFGIAKAARRVHADTGVGQIKGKVRFMAPEQITSARVDRRADVYATAAMLYEAVTGDRLFHERDTVKLMAAVLTRKHDPPSKRRPGLPPQLDGIILRALAHNPAERQATARDFATELERTMPTASQREIADWVNTIAERSLRQRSAWIGEMEKGLSSLTNTAAPPPDLPLLADASDRWPVADAPARPETSAKPAAITRRPPPRPRKRVPSDPPPPSTPPPSTPPPSVEPPSTPPPSAPAPSSAPPTRRLAPPRAPTPSIACEIDLSQVEAVNDPELPILGSRPGRKIGLGWLLAIVGVALVVVPAAVGLKLRAASAESELASPPSAATGVPVPAMKAEPTARVASAENGSPPSLPTPPLQLSPPWAPAVLAPSPSSQALAPAPERAAPSPREPGASEHVPSPSARPAGEWARPSEAQGAAPSSCNPPFTLDDAGVRIPKRWCH